jgi:chromosome segregation ATPase
MNKKIIMFAAAAVLALPIVPAFAQVTTTTPDPRMDRQAQRADIQGQRDQNQAVRLENKGLKDQNQLERGQLKDEKQANVAERCVNIQNKIGERIAKVEENKKNFGINFDNMQARLTRLSERLAAKGIDVTKLNADIQALTEKITKLKADHETFVTGLKDAQVDAPAACGTSKGEFMGRILGSRKVSATVEQDRLDIKNFFEKTIKADIMAIRKQLEATKPAEVKPAPKTETTTSELIQ